MAKILQQQSISKRPKHLLSRFVRRSWPALQWLVVAAAVPFVLWGVLFFVETSAFFNIQKIECSGSFSQTSREEILLLSGVSVGQNLFELSLEDVENNIRKNPWIKTVTVRRQAPNILWINVVEQNPRAILQDEKLYFVSSEGTIFKEVHQENARDLVVFTGFKKEDDLRRPIEVVNFFEQSSDFELFGLSEINYNAATGYSLVTLKGPVEVKLGQTDIEDKLERLKKIWPVVEKKIGRIRGIDLDYGDKIVLKL